MATVTVTVCCVKPAAIGSDTDVRDSKVVEVTTGSTVRIEDASEVTMEGVGTRTSDIDGITADEVGDSVVEVGNEVKEGGGASNDEGVATVTDDVSVDCKSEDAGARVMAEAVV
jgi:hypothetical protein